MEVVDFTLNIACDRDRAREPEAWSRHRHPITMKHAVTLLLAGSLVFLGACSKHETADQQRHEADTVAGKMGQAAHRAAVQADKAGRALGRQMAHAAHDAHEGWKEDAQRTKDRK